MKELNINKSGAILVELIEKAGIEFPIILPKCFTHKDKKLYWMIENKDEDCFIWVRMVK